MFDSYEDIFDLRGQDYHRAMQLVPGARDHEFRAAIDGLNLRRGHAVCDMPSGGEYLIRHLPESVKNSVIAIDPSSSFAAALKDRNVTYYQCSMDNTSLTDNSVDHIVSIAGLHHAEDLPAIFHEMRRILAERGTLSILEVASGLKTDAFLNDFVHRHNSMGHHGQFIDEGFRRALIQSGFRIEEDKTVRYNWTFPSEKKMVEYMTLMFGLDRATPDIIAAGLQEFLGVSSNGNVTELQWELQRIVAS